MNADLTRAEYQALADHARAVARSAGNLHAVVRVWTRPQRPVWAAGELDLALADLRSAQDRLTRLANAYEDEARKRTPTPPEAA